MNAFDPAALECLAALADAGSFDRAAQQLSITQSAVSQRLRSLETALGRLLVVRSRPLRLTEPGKVLLRYARQMQAMRADLSRELGATLGQDERLPIAVNADSLATWVLPALDPVAQAGLRDGYGLELIVDDQDFTHDWLREGAVLGCVSTVAEALRGCSAVALGTMRYIAVASPAFCQRSLPGGLNRSNFAHVPWLVFNRKDDMHALWVAKAFGVQGPRLVERFVPSTEAHVRAAVMGWGIGVMPEQMAAPALADGALVGLFPEIWIDVLLYWHQWKLRTDDSSTEPALRAGALDRIGRALIAGAREALKPAPG
ncbi:LysR family transcriptional regulator ArgP [Aquincola sp. S2]|uniref:LysR family transcriptional regulator ArgP n=1 Tax=Pseudaquabacterium terrae TaxID=2732868 RepID=A0ABX2ETG5_9BURK|nr:LysR family transcriptional regulator ArgP [Aquabacterium terrae]NRF71938.1 LysR family transcriptional regulator ArgP [Aquabacterium terrae]